MDGKKLLLMIGSIYPLNLSIQQKALYLNKKREIVLKHEVGQDFIKEIFKLT